MHYVRAAHTPGFKVLRHHWASSAASCSRSPFFVRPTEFSCRPAELACLTLPVADAVAPEGAIVSPVNPGGVVHPGQLPELTPNE